MKRMVRMLFFLVLVSYHFLFLVKQCACLPPAEAQQGARGGRLPHDRQRRHRHRQRHPVRHHHFLYLITDNFQAFHSFRRLYCRSECRRPAAHPPARDRHVMAADDAVALPGLHQHWLRPRSACDAH